MKRWQGRRAALSALGLLMAFALPQGASAIAQPKATDGRLVSALTRYCVANQSDTDKVVLAVGADGQPMGELPYALVGPMGGPFSSYRAWSLPQGRDQQPVVLVVGVEKLPGGARHICAVRGVEEGDVIAEVRALMGGARPFLKEPRMWAAFGWEEDGRIREPTPDEMGADIAKTPHRVAFTIIREEDQVSINVARVVVDAVQK